MQPGTARDAIWAPITRCANIWHVAEGFTAGRHIRTAAVCSRSADEIGDVGVRGSHGWDVYCRSGSVQTA
jgi:hypothetical protein